jgi:hypothetical protein
MSYGCPVSASPAAGTTEAERIARRLAETLPRVKRGTLRFWGSWFGRPYDNQHEISGCEAEGDELTVRFTRGEVLRVWAPQRATVNEATFRIGEASRVRWEWLPSGDPGTPAGVCFQDFVVDGAAIKAETNARWGAGRLDPDRSQPAVEIL